MTSDKLENLVRAGLLKREPPRPDELAGLKQSGLPRLADPDAAPKLMRYLPHWAAGPREGQG
jgi:hypothetical protein